MVVVVLLVGGLPSRQVQYPGIVGCGPQYCPGGQLPEQFVVAQVHGLGVVVVVVLVLVVVVVLVLVVVVVVVVWQLPQMHGVVSSCPTVVPATAGGQHLQAPEVQLPVHPGANSTHADPPHWYWH